MLSNSVVAERRHSKKLMTPVSSAKTPFRLCHRLFPKESLVQGSEGFKDDCLEIFRLEVCRVDLGRPVCWFSHRLILLEPDNLVPAASSILTPLRRVSGVTAFL
jgi:hypothetical protein